jgi:hypothetical protein
MKMKIIIILSLSIISIQACKHCDCEKKISKIDIQSQAILKDAESLPNEHYLPILIEFNKELSDEEFSLLKEMKIKNITKIGKIISCQANVDSIHTLLDMQTVKSVEINKEKKTK